MPSSRLITLSFWSRPRRIWIKILPSSRPIYQVFTFLEAKHLNSGLIAPVPEYRFIRVLMYHSAHRAFYRISSFTMIFFGPFTDL